MKNKKINYFILYLSCHHGIAYGAAAVPPAAGSSTSLNNSTQTPPERSLNNSTTAYPSLFLHSLTKFQSDYLWPLQAAYPANCPDKRAPSRPIDYVEGAALRDAQPHAHSSFILPSQGFTTTATAVKMGRRPKRLRSRQRLLACWSQKYICSSAPLFTSLFFLLQEFCVLSRERNFNFGGGAGPLYSHPLTFQFVSKTKILYINTSRSLAQITLSY